MNRSAFSKYVYAVAKCLHKGRRTASVCFENPQSTKPYFAASIELSRNKMYWLVGSPLCPPEDFPKVIREKVLGWHTDRSLRVSTLLGYTVLANNDLPLPEEMAELIVKEHKISASKKKNAKHLIILNADR